jgi:hypothetical protein
VANYFRASPNCTGAGGTCTLSYLVCQRDTPIEVPIAYTHPLLPIMPIPFEVQIPGGDDQPKKPESIDPFLGNLNEFSPSPSPGPVGTGLMYGCRCL